jgi:Protein of unknown function (DUF3168)
MIEKGLFQLIQSDSSITSLVSATNGNGVYWILAPKAATFPLIVVSRIATTDTNTVAGDVGFRNALFQVDCYAGDYYTSRSVAAAVRELLESYKGTLADGTVVNAVFQTKDWDFPYEEGSVGFIYRAMQEFRIWYFD